MTIESMTRAFRTSLRGRKVRPASGLFERALKRVLILPREVDDLRNLGLGHFVSEDAAHTDALLVDLEHDAGRILDTHRKEALQAQDDKLHRSIIVVQHQDLVVA